MSRKLLWLAAASLLFAALPLAAHHSFAAEFDGSKTLTMKGVVSKVDWVNPHIFIYIDVKDDSGKTTTWMLQSLPPLFFLGSGLTKEGLMGKQQEVTFTANPAKDGTKAYGFVTSIKYADGLLFTMAPPAEPKGR